MNALSSNRSNLPYDLLAARQLICEDTGLDPRTLRFAGELLQVHPDFAQWSGAIERVLRPLALVMLVPAAHALKVSQSVNAHYLGTSLKCETISRQQPERPRASVVNSLVQRVQVADTPMRAWLEHRLSTRFDYQCVDSVEELQATTQGVTLAGQVKRSAHSFEKTIFTRSMNAGTGSLVSTPIPSWNSCSWS